ncbi:hypothetical protein LEP1GSC161_1463 [Leptospira santarosai str. CBC1416]|uniref:Uncharacterized protein n=1 Tax=Leptospira santarosai str. CBC1416 TaxID=1193059 RepID=M6VN09_9LEPT|nr:hypothetical protein LEP1GSC161_1463 [Leptospira santarosai str. CBC1416]
MFQSTYSGKRSNPIPFFTKFVFFRFRSLASYAFFKVLSKPKVRRFSKERD